MQPPLHAIEPVAWVDLEHFFETLGCVVVRHPELRWYQESWGAITRAGYSNLYSGDSQIKSRLQAILLLKMYLGIYQQPSLGSELEGYLSEGDPCGLSEMIDILHIGWSDLFDIVVAEGLFALENIWETIREQGEPDALIDRALAGCRSWDGVRDLLYREGRADLIESVVDSWLDSDGLDVVEDLIRVDNDWIYGVLSRHYGDNAGLFASIWNSRNPLDQVKPIEVIVNSDVSEGKITTLAYVEDGMRNWH